MDRVIATQWLPDGRTLDVVHSELPNGALNTFFTRCTGQQDGGVILFQPEYLYQGVTEEALLAILLTRLKGRADNSPAMQKARANLEHALSNLAVVNKSSLVLAK